MRIPPKDVGGFSKEIYDRCTASRTDRLQRGATFRSIYLSGSETGNPATFNKTFEFIDNLGSFLYSPVDLRFMIDSYGMSNLKERAKLRAATDEFYRQFRRCGTDTILESAVTWGLVKGKTFIKNSWTSQGFKDVLIQPEMMGVLEENLDSLDDQDAFCHTTYLTPDKLNRMLRTNPDRNELMRKAMTYSIQGGKYDDPEHENTLRQIIVGGMQPYQVQGQSNNVRGQVRWLDAPQPQFAAQVYANLIPVHELWIWDDDRANDDDDLDGEYTTIQFIGENLVLRGELTHRNVFADQYEPLNREKKKLPSSHNPLAGRHPFTEICPNPLDGYFWGRSEIFNIALLQESINSRMDGINRMLRRQEDPPKFFSGVSGIKQAAYSMIKKAGGYLTDSNPNAKATDLYPQLPEGIWESLHELEAMFDKMGGFPDVMQGRGSSGVRSQGHAETLTRNAAPRFKDRALLIERQIEAMGGLKLDMLRAHVPQTITSWVPQKEAGVEGAIPQAIPEAPPVPGLVPVDFTFYDLPDDCKVSVDSHSSSPAFAHETMTLLFDLVKIGAIKPERLIEHLHPPGAGVMIQDIERAAAEKAAFAAAHPELAAQEESKGRKKK
jgi:hypothetical protein